jgi:hypothetical protein
MNTNTKNIVAILMATIIAMAMITPMAMAEDTSADVGNLPPYICCKWEEDSAGNPSTSGDFYVSPIAPDVTIKACICDPNVDPIGACTEITDEIASVTATVTDGADVSYTVTLEPVMSGGCPVVCECPPVELCVCKYVGYDSRLLPCYLYEATLTMDGCDPSGDYEVTVVAEDVSGGVSAAVENTFFYDGGFTLETDFTEVAYGEVVIGQTKVVSGYAIHNAGNQPSTVTLTASTMTHAKGFPTVDMNLDASIGEEVNKPLPAGVPVQFAHMFTCCIWTPVEFSITPPAGLPEGSYTGTITISMP